MRDLRVSQVRSQSYKMLRDIFASMRTFLQRPSSKRVPIMPLPA